MINSGKLDGLIHGQVGTMNGFRIIMNTSLVDKHEKLVERTWKERLFTLPWTPLIKIRTEVYFTPAEKVIKFGDILHVHPETWSKIEKVIPYAKF